MLNFHYSFILYFRSTTIPIILCIVAFPYSEKVDGIRKPIHLNRLATFALPLPLLLFVESTRNLICLTRQYWHSGLAQSRSCRRLSLTLSLSLRFSRLSFPLFFAPHVNAAELCGSTDMVCLWRVVRDTPSSGEAIPFFNFQAASL